MKNKYKDLSKEELIELIQKLHRRKKYGLVWEEKPEDVVEQCKKELPVLEEIKEKALEINKNLPTNLLIEGDNYHAVSVLNYTHAGKVDVIYIDPPYNTGAKDWKYNNDYVDINDRFRHSKWISMMYKRIYAAKNLLKNTGVIMVAIDDHEVHNLRHILNEVFYEKNYIATIAIEINPAGQNIRQNTPAISHDYCLIYARNIEAAKLITRQLTSSELAVFTEEDEKGSYVWDNLRRRGGNSTPADRPGQWYPLYVSKDKSIISLNKFEDSIEVYPIDPKGIKRIWRVSPEGFMREYEEGNIGIIQKKDRFEIGKKSYAPAGRKPKTIWKEPYYSATSHGTKLLIDILGKNNFTYPKSLYAVKDCLQYYADKDSLILDFFAGSGTTGHAAMMLNEEDNGNRRFILCTNNENGIAEDVCYPRIKNIIKGYSKVKGIPANLRYFKTAFVSKSKVSDDTRRELVNRSTEMICVRENTFEKVMDKKEFKIFKDNEHATGILFDLDEVESFKEKLRGQNMPANIYVFSLTKDTFDEDFEDLGLEHELCPIPESILEVYKKLFK